MSEARRLLEEMCRGHNARGSDGPCDCDACRFLAQPMTKCEEREKWLRVQTDHGEVAHMATRVDGGWRTLCGRNVQRMHSSLHRSLCWPCMRRAPERGIKVRP